jgi:hypothetical protein
VPAAPPPENATGAQPADAQRPTSVRVATILLAVLALLLLLNATLSWIAREALVDSIIEANPDVSRDEAERFLLLSVLPYGVIGLIAAVSAWSLPRRRAWARWAGLTATALLGLLTLWSVLAAGGVTVASLLVLVLCVAVVTSLLARSTSAWFPRLREKG